VITVLNHLDGTVRSVLRTPSEWSEFWMNQRLPSYATVPDSLDFSEEMVLIVASDGMKDVAWTWIDSTWRGRDTLKVIVAMHSGRSCSMPTVGEAVDAVSVPKMDIPVQFVDRRLEPRC
jgi:hypothetical protein